LERGRQGFAVDSLFNVVFCCVLFVIVLFLVFVFCVDSFTVFGVLFTVWTTSFVAVTC
jgi:hypothetical protein